jgi:hypothetical protein
MCRNNNPAGGSGGAGQSAPGTGASDALILHQPAPPVKPLSAHLRAYQCSNKCPARPGLGLGVRRLPCVHQEHNGSLADG